MRYGRENYDEQWPAWRPIVGTVVVLVLLFGSLGARSRGTVPNDLPGLVGYTLGTVIVFYGLLYLFALRNAAIGWRVGAFLLVAAAAAFVNLARAGEGIGDLRREMASIRDDASAILEGKQLQSGGDGQTPSGVMRNFLVTLQKDQKAFDDKIVSAGIPALLSPDELRRDPKILKDCAATDRLAEAMKAYRANLAGRFAAMRRSFETMKASDEVRRDMLAGFDEAITQDRPDVERRLELSGNQLAELGTICRVLARHNWRFEGGQPAFTNQGDMAAFNAAVNRYNGMLAEQSALEQKARANARASLREMDQR